MIQPSSQSDVLHFEPDASLNMTEERPSSRRMSKSEGSKRRSRKVSPSPDHHKDRSQRKGRSGTKEIRLLMEKLENSCSSFSSVDTSSLNTKVSPASPPSTSEEIISILGRTSPRMGVSKTDPSPAKKLKKERRSSSLDPKRRSSTRKSTEDRSRSKSRDTRSRSKSKTRRSASENRRSRSKSKSRRTRTIPQEQTKKSVSFKSNEKGNLVVRVRHVRRYHTPEDVWWNDAEMRSFRTNAQQMAAKLRNNQDYQWALNILFQKEGPPASDEDVDQACWIVTSQFGISRGLETHVCNRIMDHNDEHEKTVVLATRFASANDTQIRRESRASSKPSRMFATTLAELDAQEAAVVYTCELKS